MSWALFLLLLVTGAVLLAALGRHRRIASERRRQASVERLEEAIRRGGKTLEVLSGTRGELSLGEVGTDSSLGIPLERIEELEHLEPLLAGAEFLLERRAETLSEPLELRKHGMDLGPLLVPCGWLAAFPDGAMTPHTRLGDTELCAIYRFLSPDHLLFLDAQSLESIGLDVDGLHGAMMALLSQRFDEQAIEQLLAGEAALDLRDDQGLASSFLFLIPELVPEGSELWARAPQPGRLLIASDSTSLAEMEVGQALLSSAPMKVRSSGVERQKGVSTLPAN